MTHLSNDSPIHLPLPPEYTSDEVWSRVSEDKKINIYGKELIDLCISNGLNGIIGIDKEQGAFTCVTPRGSSVVDYLVASIDLFKLIADFNIRELSTLSDHCPLTTKIDSHSTFQLQNLRRSAGSLLDEVLDRMTSSETSPNRQIYWSSELITELKDYFRTDTFKHKLSSLMSQLDTDKANENISRFTDLLQTTVRSCSNAKLKPNTHKYKPFPRNSWFNAEYKHNKKEVKLLAKRMQKHPDYTLTLNNF